MNKSERRKLGKKETNILRERETKINQRKEGGKIKYKIKKTKRKWNKEKTKEKGKIGKKKKIKRIKGRKMLS